MRKIPPFKQLLAAAAGLASLAFGTAAPLAAQQAPAPKDSMEPAKTMSDKSEKIILAGGCFWCTEAVFERVEGVTKVVSGYSGGAEKNPTYKQVSAGSTGHTESIQVTFDPGVTSLDKILDVFWQAHDPTQVNRQGPDHGTQYRSAIFYFSDEQKAVIDQSLAKAKTMYDKPIATEIKPAGEFWPAEGYHQNYFYENPNDRYCQINLVPKLHKLEKKDVIKEERNTAPGL